MSNKILVIKMRKKPKSISLTQAGSNLSFVSESKMEPPDLNFLDFEIMELLALFLFCKMFLNWKILNSKLGYKTILFR